MKKGRIAMHKRILAAMTALIMVLTLIPSTAFAEEGDQTGASSTEDETAVTIDEAAELPGITEQDEVEEAAVRIFLKPLKKKTSQRISQKRKNRPQKP